MAVPQLAMTEVIHTALGEMALTHQSGYGAANPKLAFCTITLIGPK